MKKPKWMKEKPLWSMRLKTGTERSVKDSWIWIDTNNDSIAECYRFDKDGYIAINYEDQYFIKEKGFVGRKYQSIFDAFDV